jgi:hypothetical protein
LGVVVAGLDVVFDMHSPHLNGQLERMNPIELHISSKDRLHSKPSSSSQSASSASVQRIFEVVCALVTVVVKVLVVAVVTVVVAVAVGRLVLIVVVSAHSVSEPDASAPAAAVVPAGQSLQMLLEMNWSIKHSIALHSVS